MPMRPPPFKNLRCRPGIVPGVWNLALPLWWWKWRAANAELRFFADSCARNLRHRLVCLDWDDGPDGWRVLDENRVLWDMPEIDYGGWVLSLSESSLSRLEGQEAGLFPRSDSDALEYLRLTGARCAFWAWKDDREWRYALRP